MLDAYLKGMYIVVGIVIVFTLPSIAYNLAVIVRNLP